MVWYILKMVPKVDLMKRWSLITVFGLVAALIFSFYGFSSVLAEDKNVPGGVIPKLPQTVNDPELTNGRVYPPWGPVCQRYSYSVIYRDKEGRPPEYMKMYFNGKMIDIEKQNPQERDYKKGVRYEYKYVPNKLGSNFYYFEASNGLGKARESIIDSPDNGPVLFESAFERNEVAVIDASTGQKILSFSTGKEWVGGIALSDDGKYLAAKTSQHVYLFDTAQPQKPIWQFTCEDCRIGDDVKGGVDISGDGAKIVAAIGQSILLFDKSNQNPLWRYTQAGNAYNVAISRDGNYLAAATAGEESNLNANLIILWGGTKKEPLWQYHASGNFHDVSLSDDGSFIAGSTGCPDRRAYLFIKDSNQPVIKTDPLTRDSPVHRAKISADGAFFAVGSEADRGAVFLFGKNSTSPVWKFSTKGNSSVRALNFTPDGKHIGAATFGGDAYIFSQASDQPLAGWKINASLGGIDIADDGSFIAAGGTDNQLHILKKDKSGDQEIGFSEFVEEIDISGNGKYVAAGTGGSVYFFETIKQNLDKVYPCTEVIEPPSEAEFMKQNEGRDELNGTREKSSGFFAAKNKWPGMLFGFGVLGSLVTLILYLAIKYINFLQPIKDRLRQINQNQSIKIFHLTHKKIILFLSAFTLLFLMLTIMSAFFNRPGLQSTKTEDLTGEPEKRIKNEEQSGNDGGQVQPVCGNSMCEPDFGETKENCAKDCSAGD